MATQEKFLHIWFNYNYPRYSTCFIPYEVEHAFTNKESCIHTTLTRFSSLSYIEKGYRVIIHPFIGKEFEIKLGDTVNGRLIRIGLNIEKLLYLGEFDNANTKVIGI